MLGYTIPSIIAKLSVGACLFENMTSNWMQENSAFKSVLPLCSVHTNFIKNKTHQMIYLMFVSTTLQFGQFIIHYLCCFAATPKTSHISTGISSAYMPGPRWELLFFHTYRYIGWWHQTISSFVFTVIVVALFVTAVLSIVDMLMWSFWPWISSSSSSSSSLLSCSSSWLCFSNSQIFPSLMFKCFIQIGSWLISFCAFGTSHGASAVAAS